MYLNELARKPDELKGVGPKTSKALAKAGVHSVADLLQYYPRSYEDRQTSVSLSEAEDGKRVNTIITVLGQEYFGWGPKKTLKVWVKDDTGSATLVCYGRNFLADKLRNGTTHRLTGLFQYKFSELQSSSFEFEEVIPGGEMSRNFGRILPIYSLNAELTQGVLRKALDSAMTGFAQYLEEELPLEVIKNNGLLPLSEAIKNIHFPENPEKMRLAAETLKYRELFYLQLMVGRRAWERRSQTRDRANLTGVWVEKLLKNLPFSLTKDQEMVLQEILGDMSGGTSMARLVQGDVGSGKTLIAFLAVLYCRERGQQAAFMAPTEILARQHGENAAKLLEPLGIRLGFLTGNLKDKNRKYLLEALKNGEIDLLIGTHALFTKDVHFPDLGLIIVDEQHRFGVNQRLALKKKGKSPDFLLMTATPIPRTLAMTAFGDLDVSLIKTMPPGRIPIETHLCRDDREEKVFEWVRREIDAGHQIYFVFPLIEESEKLNLRNAEEGFRLLQEKIFPGIPMTLIHSRIPEEEKRSRMGLFTSGEAKILAATSVVEVGVDVPNATCMVIHNAERFGLSALHQLRGRVGRGKSASYCFLIFGETLSEDGKARLKVMKESTDGFRIAEEDLKIRGPGDLTGKLQSGFLQLKIADITLDTKLLTQAREDAFHLVQQDPGLLSPDNKGLREVLERCPPYPSIFLESG
ncbi:MAG: ATP-dependent DNA helicase RecG [Spirochaetales bacterium]|nr:ATP-dependent DNA helicase RecG [Spirochaetales bacterium]